jgi:hypothetical protein
MLKPHLQSRYRPHLLPARLFRQAAICSKKCRDTYIAERIVAPAFKCPRAETYFELLFAQPIALAQPQLVLAAVRVRRQSALL